MWHISDTHFNHENIIKYCNRPFLNTGEMDEHIISKWNSVVKRDDIIFHHGDFSLGMSREEIKSLVDRLNGKITLIIGNHDRKGVSFFKECGFVAVHKKPIFINKYILSHKPLDELSIPDGFINIHGHVHNYGNLNKDKYLNVSCEVLGYQPLWIDNS